MCGSKDGVTFKTSSTVYVFLLGVFLWQTLNAETLSGKVLNHIRSGKLRALAVTSDARLSQLPDVPTMAEAGFSGAESSSFFAFAVAKDTPAFIVQTLSAKIAEVMRDPGIKTQLTELGAIPVGNTPAQATRYLNEQVVKWAKVVKASGAKAD
jgi:hypothetical protein